MLCDICHKNPATVHLTEIIDNQMTELHLCEPCAQEKSAQREQQFGLSDLLAGMAEFSKPQQKEAEPAVALKCPNCGMTYENFRKIGRLGCGECYNSLRRYLAPLLKRIHGSNQHLGKSPSRATRIIKKKMDLQELRNRLKTAIETEAFEEAAKIRDKIRELERKANESRPS